MKQCKGQSKSNLVCYVINMIVVQSANVCVTWRVVFHFLFRVVEWFVQAGTSPAPEHPFLPAL